MALAKKVVEKNIIDISLQNLVEKVSATTGEKFCHCLVKNIVEILNTDIAIIGELHSDKKNVIKTLAVCKGGELIENFEYPLKDSPCENVIGKSLCSYPRDVAAIFPKDRLLKEMNIEGYIGIPLFNSKRSPIGLLVVLHGKPIEKITLIESILSLFAVRTATEMERLKVEKELTENEERLKLLFQYAPDGYYLTDQAGNFIEGNLQAEAISGYDSSELKGVNFVEANMLSYDQIPKAIEMLGKTTMGMPAGPTEFLLKRKDGTFIPVEIRAYPVKIKDKMMILNIARDITERKKSEKQLIESEDRFRRLAENISEGLTVIEKGRMTYCNERLCKIYGLSKDEITKETLSECIVPEERKSVMEKIGNFMKSGDNHYSVKYHILRKDGERRFIRKSFNIATDTEGKITCYVVTSDLTDEENEE